MYEQTLKNIGLNQHEAEMYEVLLDLGPSTLQGLKSKTEISRGNIYNTLYALRDKGLVIEMKHKKKTISQAETPDKLGDLLAGKEQEFLRYKKNLTDILPNLKSMYVLGTEKPTIRYYEGVEGLKKIYDDILAEGKDFQFVRSVYDPTYTKKILPKATRPFVKKRVAKGIKAYSITTDQPQAHHDPERDKEMSHFRQWVPKEYYDVPVEVVIYGDKIAFLSFAKDLTGAIIENKNIAEAMRKMFIMARRGAKEIYRESKKS